MLQSYEGYILVFFYKFLKTSCFVLKFTPQNAELYFALL